MSVSQPRQSCEQVEQILVRRENFITAITIFPDCFFERALEHFCFDFGLLVWLTKLSILHSFRGFEYQIRVPLMLLFLDYYH